MECVSHEMNYIHTMFSYSNTTNKRVWEWNIQIMGLYHAIPFYLVFRVGWKPIINLQYLCSKGHFMYFNEKGKGWNKLDD